MIGFDAWALGHELQVTGQRRAAVNCGSAGGGANPPAIVRRDEQARLDRAMWWRERVRFLTNAELEAREDKCLLFIAWAITNPTTDLARRWLGEARILIGVIGDEWHDRTEPPPTGAALLDQPAPWEVEDRALPVVA